MTTMTGFNVSKIVDGHINRMVGYSVSLSGDGKTALFGGYNISDSKGLACIYENRNGTWTQTFFVEGDIPQSYLGAAVHLSRDGQTAIVSDFGEYNTGGSVYIYEKQRESWIQTVILVSEVPGNWFGKSVNLNHNGTIAIIGASVENDYTGVAYIYTKIDGVWVQTARIDSEIADSDFGNSVSLNDAGNIALIGSYLENDGMGAAYIYTNQDGIWSQSTKMSSGVVAGYFGHMVHLNSTGDIALIGADGDNSGAVFIYTNQNGIWTQTARIINEIARNQFDWSVALDGTGKTAIIGTWLEKKNTGAAYIYTNREGVWSQTARISSENAETNFGSSVSLNSDGTIALIGEPGANNQTGAIYIAE